jgi:hypothetical protein
LSGGHQGILEREVLPENYRFVARRDRLKSAHGGVAVIAKSDLEGVEVETPSDTELLIGIVYLFPFIDVVCRVCWRHRLSRWLSPDKG